MTQLPKSHVGSLPNKTRRTLLKAGIAGGVVLVLARWMVTSYSPRESPEVSGSALDPSEPVRLHTFDDRPPLLADKAILCSLIVS